MGGAGAGGAAAAGAGGGAGGLSGASGGAGGRGGSGGTGGSAGAGGGIDAGSGFSDAPPAAACLAWGPAEATRRWGLEVAGGAAGIPAGTWVSISLDHAALVAAGRSRADGNDVRLLRWDGQSWSDVPFFLDERSRWNTANTTLWLRTAAAVAPNAQDRSYYIYVGALGATASLAKRPTALLRSVQTGTAVQDRSGTVSVALQQIDPARSFVLFQSRHANTRPTGALIQARLVETGRALELERIDADPAPGRMDVRYYVLEFSNGVRVQRGVVKQSAGIVNATLPAPVAIDQTFLLWSKTPQVLGYDWDSNDPTVLTFRDTRTIESRVGAYRDADHEVAWEAVELTNPEDARVQRGWARIDNYQSDVIDAPTRPVDLTRTLLLAGFLVPGTGPRTFGGKMMRATATGPSNLAFHRSFRASYDMVVGWQLIELGAGASVKSGTIDFLQGEGQKRVPLSPVVDPTRAAAVASVQVGGGQDMGATPYTDADLIGVCSVTLSFSANGGELVAERTSTADRCSIGWSVVQYPRTGEARAATAFEGPGCAALP